MAALSPVTAGVLIILAVHDVQRGSDITSCSMECPDEKAVLSLYKVCGGNETLLVERPCDDKWCGNETLLVERRCNDKWRGNVTEPRFHLDTSSGCWTLTGAGEEDSCVYSAVDLRGTYQMNLTISVIDPIIITNITSNSTRLGEDIAVSVHFSGNATSVTWEVDGGPLPDRYHLIDDNRTMIIQRAQKDDAGRRLRIQITNPVSNKTLEHQLPITDPGSSWRLICGVSAAVIGFLILLIGYLVQRRKKMKLRGLENDGGHDHSEEHGRLSSSSPDADEEKKTGWRHLMNLIGRLCRNRPCEEPPQIEMEENKRLTTPA